MRLDKYLKEQYPDLSRQKIINQIKKGLVLVNNHKAKPSFQVKPTDKIIFSPPKTEKLQSLKPAPFNLKIIFEDNNILVIDKPAGLSVHPSLKQLQGITLVNQLISRYPEIKKVGEDKLRPGLVHRLDKDTSGVLIIAKNNQTFQLLKEKFKRSEVKKTYWALVWGQVENEKGVIDLPIGRSRKNPLKQTVGQTGNLKIRPAITEYRVLKRFQDFTLLEIYPKTGRMHQIRVHLKAIGHPVVGDSKYGFKKLFPFELKRQFLHAKVLELELNGQRCCFESDLADDLKLVLDQLARTY